MKKSQILAALALAFALGVVAPVAGVYAAPEDDDTAEQAEQGNDKLTTNSQKAAKAAVKEVKQSFSAITTVLNEDGDEKEVYTGAAAYGYINDNATTLKTALDFVKNEEKQDGKITKAFQGKVKTETDKLVDPIENEDVKELLNSADDWAEADLATSKETVKQIIKFVDDAAKAETNQDNKDALVKIFHNLQELITNAEIQKLVDAEIANKTFTGLDTLYNELTGKTAGTIATEAKLNTITTAIKNGLGTANWSKYLRVYKLVNNIDNGLADRSASDTTLDRWVSQLKGANNASGDNTVTPADPDTSIKPGNTGALNSAAEGTASTTVSIVAGLATALTALGAGVVAYRNARRSSEN